VFAATVNKPDFLRDETGNRRFWPVLCGAIDIDALARDRDQLLAEAYARYQAGESWWLEGSDLIRRAQAEQAARLESDAWDSLVLEWALERLAGGYDSVSVVEALQFCLQMPRGTWKTSDSMRVGRAFRAAGWERFRKRDGQIFDWRYRPPGSGMFPLPSTASGNGAEVGTDIPTCG
jgi:predicted P-loop ATPase